MGVYLLKLTACLLLFLSFYKLILEKENMHVFKRFYLLASLILSICIPLITFTYYVEPSSQAVQLNDTILLNEATEQQSLIAIYLPYLLWSIYLGGVLLFGFKFVRNLYSLDRKIKYNPKKRTKQFTNVLLQDQVTPHTFFNYLFFNKNKFEAQEIPNEVFWHEQTHAEQKHSIDVLCIEIFQVIFWFNPLVYFFKHAIKLNHEFLADQGVLNKGINTSTYQETILAFSSNATEPQLANAINYSLIKKRFTVMKTKTTKKSVWLRSFVFLPLLAIMLFSFSNKEVIERTTDSETIIPKDKIASVESFLEEESLSEPIEAIQEGATRAQMKEYNKLAKKYNSQSEDDRIIKRDDIKRLEYLYSLMSDKQKKDAEPFPNVPPPPPAPKAPSPVKAAKPDLPPPPPPIPSDATPAQRKKYKDATRRYERAVEKAAKANTELVRVREINDAERVKLRKVKEQYEVQRAAKLKEEKVRVVELKEKMAAERKLQTKERKVQLERIKEERMVEREAMSDQRLAKLKQEKIKHNKERLALAEQRQQKLKQQKLKLVKERQALAEQRRDVQKIAKLKREEERALREVRSPRPPRSPMDHVVDMAKKNAVFYFEGKEISSDDAIKILKENKKMNISTVGADSKRPKVHLSTKPMVREIKVKN